MPGTATKALAFTSDVTPRYCEADAYEGGKQAVAEAWRNLTATGAEPLAATDNLNFGNPERPEIMGQLVHAVKGIGDACRALGFPIVSGNVSLYNETNGRGILPTPTIGGVGLIPDWGRMARASFAAEGEAILLFGAPDWWGTHLGQSIYLRELFKRKDGTPPPVDLEHERKVGDLVRILIRDGVATAVHDLSDGGLAMGLAEMAMASGHWRERQPTRWRRPDPAVLRRRPGAPLHRDHEPRKPREVLRRGLPLCRRVRAVPDRQYRRHRS